MKKYLVIYKQETGFVECQGVFVIDAETEDEARKKAHEMEGLIPSAIRNFHAFEIAKLETPWSFWR